MPRTGYDSIADKPAADSRVHLVGTGEFEWIDFLGTQAETMQPGPGLVCAQLYFYKSKDALGKDITPPIAWMIQTQRGNGDPTADDTCYWPAGYPFSYVGKVYFNLDWVSVEEATRTRGIRIKLPKGARLDMGTHVIKLDTESAFAAAGISAAED